MKSLLAALVAVEEKLRTARNELAEVDIEQLESLASQFSALNKNISICHSNIEKAKIKIFSALSSMILSTTRGGEWVRLGGGITIKKEGVWKGSAFFPFSQTEIATPVYSQCYYAVCNAMIDYLSQITPERSKVLEQVMADFVRISEPLNSLVKKCK